MKKTILIFADYYLPGYLAGGPIRSISNMVDWLGDAFDFKIITSNCDYTKTKPYKEVKTNQWNDVGDAQVFYFDGRLKHYPQLIKEVKKLDADVLYFNSFFSPKFTILPLFFLKILGYVKKSRILIASRGEFSPDALHIKQQKKRAYLWFITKTGFLNGINWCFTNEKEKQEFLDHIDIPYKSINILPNLPKRISPAAIGGIDKQKNNIRIVYLSRVASIKNLYFALEVLKEIEHADIVFHIYGIKDDPEYWEKCSNLIASLPENVTVDYKGHVPNDEVPDILSNYHLFFLPTKSENFGHAIYEALLCGTPVLISDRTPWRNLGKKNLGWDVPLNNKEKFKESILEVARMDKKRFKIFKENVLNAIQTLEVQQSVNKNLEVFNRLTG